VLSLREGGEHVWVLVELPLFDECVEELVEVADGDGPKHPALHAVLQLIDHLNQDIVRRDVGDPDRHVSTRGLDG
jgi:hypothetical protein